ncbi:XTP/dITP diphosphohydrolase [Peptoniphilus ivorii]|uniref:RdgB/HAM1 family non-canonical purine NTP pyrophosphatase n=1 Tax=Aedoeadaptatus ivorii TaxID=54006 RepID=UPI002782653C|nr:RdgB/HAM1 family non-canonical purine NTP pyrophosphatase [Peptoniphilus ivorii]MDQ0507891.1 XTP/dITP diphosphohydrolase [Peptoniphilus ivorii]
MKIIVSTDNRHKLQEIREMLGSVAEIVSKTEAGFGDVYVVEDGDSLEANAIKKVEPLEGEVVIGDDTGLFVDALDGAPGVYSSRYSGADGDDAKNRAKLLRAMEDAQCRDAHFTTVIAVKKKDGTIYTVEGTVYGTIAERERGEDGFGYDALFIPEGSDRTFAEMQADEKNACSHRRRALDALKKSLSEIGEKI